VGWRKKQGGEKGGGNAHRKLRGEESNMRGRGGGGSGINGAGVQLKAPAVGGKTGTCFFAHGKGLKWEKTIIRTYTAREKTNQ